MSTTERWTDLHIHTVKSDGSYTVAEVFERAKEEGLSAISITDHDTVAAYTEAKELEQKTGVEFVPGVELSAMYEGREVHIIGLYLDCGDAELNEKLQFFQKKRSERAKKIIRKLREKNINLDYEELYEMTENLNSAGRLHVARLMVKKNFARSIKDAFDRFLAEGRPAYVEKAELTVADAINMIKRVGGVSVLAHPGLLNKDEAIKEWKKLGLDGVEVFHSDHDAADIKRYFAIAEENNLLVSGGSDFHGASKEYVSLGKIRLAYEYFEKIKQYHLARINK